MATVRGGITVKPHVQRFADDLERAIPEANNFGTYNGHSPPEGPTQALDIFNSDNSAGYALQDRVAEFARKNAKRYGVRYVIRRHQIWNIERDDEGWRNQGVTGNRTADHYDHTHVTFYASVLAPFADDAPAPQAPKEDQLFSKSPVYTVHVIASHSGLLLSSTGAHHGAGVVQRPADGSLAQRWEVWGHDNGEISLVNRDGGFALDRPDYSTEAGTTLQVARTEHNAAQRWALEQVKPFLARLWAPGTNRLVDIRNRSVEAAGEAQLWYGRDDDDPRNQHFVFAVTV